MVEWRRIPGWDDYWVSEEGQISFQGGPINGILKTSTKKKGYLFVNLRHKSRKTTMYNARAVLLAFVGPPPYGNGQAHHQNGCVDDNVRTNLSWRISINQYEHGLEDDIDRYPSSPEDEEEQKRMIEALRGES